MREIKFRGKRIDNGEWVYGHYYTDPTGGYLHSEHGLMEGTASHFIMAEDMNAIEADPATVGQYTGLKDKNGVEIYEGDILKDEENNLWTVEWGKTGYVVFGVELCGNDLLEHGNDYIVAGNIHENPELLPQ